MPAFINTDFTSSETLGKLFPSQVYSGSLPRRRIGHHTAVCQPAAYGRLAYRQCAAVALLNGAASSIEVSQRQCRCRVQIWRGTNSTTPSTARSASRSEQKLRIPPAVGNLLTIHLFDGVANVCGRALAIDVDDLGRWEPVEMRRRCVRIRTNVFAVDKVAEFQVRQFLGQ